MSTHEPPQKTGQSTHWWVLGFAVVSAGVLGLWYFRSGEHGRGSRLADEPEQQEDYRGSGVTRAEQRLRELRAAHQSASGSALEGDKQARASEEAQGGRFQVPERGVGATTSTKVKPKAGASAAGAEDGDATADSGYDEPDPDDIPALKRMALEDPDPDRRLAAVTLLGASDDPQAIPILAEVLKDQDEEVRLAAIQSLADMTGDVPVEVLGNAALSDPSPDNRYEALEALADLAGPAARPYLERALHDPDEDVASLAESLLELEREGEEERGDSTSPSMREPR